ncbi:hypothetical protein OESDEN_17984 [Oesophagostomum dentatum]|uniref:Amidase domain-containing protein n=1 Tax=Oesophagostomum dentatum TaxID=61180 RepID=A0A0B1SAJ2_OESDE|nr:hypothetical protein OESDEN_17984 [Oesophagostomum dentatum]
MFRVKRCVLETVERLKREGHELVRFTIPKQEEMVRILYKLFMASGNEYLKSFFDDELVDPFMKEFVMLLKVPNCFRWLASLVLKNISPQLSAVCASYVSDLRDLRHTQEQRDDYKAEFIDYWKSLGIDAVVCPTFPVPAVAHRFLPRMPTIAVYTALYNLLDFPAGAVPAGEVTTQDDEDLLNNDKYPVGT